MINILLNGLHRLEYRGYDSAGLAIDQAVLHKENDLKFGDCDPNQILIIKRKGKVSALVQAVKGF